MKPHLYKVPDNKKVRVIIDTDAYAEGDDQFAIVHALLTPKFDVVGIIAEQFGENGSMEKSYDEIIRILTLMELEDKIPVFRGAEEALANTNTAKISDGAKFIVEEALKIDERPLFVLNIGAITNLASAYLINPDIQDKLLAVWIGGGPYPKGHMDFNSANDINAVNIIMGSQMELWQIPLTAYTMMEVSFHELFDRVRPCGNIGRYLVDNLLRVSDLECASGFDALPFARNSSKAAKTMIIRSGEGWSLGDNPAVGVLITPQLKNSEIRPAQFLNSDGSYGEFVGEERTIRVHHSIDSRVILEDMFTKIRYHYGE
ncbi:nucleoside hydrolase [Vibrio sp. HA2012]|uniref:nucleoside hydrolase n=1 Tax=Vibrio sp. HA2012 TaxID=1971595 RepID=UPI000C2C4217|nr:nucleoside hydrolase [Vibrio sp. HA2012]PJC87199.1 nucleoside hydrolase [Vibrio sp. HA2012]